jgi:hypothetical protein
VTAAALRARRGQPLRTIRVLYAGSEELGGFGGAAYAGAMARRPMHWPWKATLAPTGCGRSSPPRARFRCGEGAAGGCALNPLGIVSQEGEVEGDRCGAHHQGTASAGGRPCAGRDALFDLHHTPDDTLDKIDPARLEQNVAAWTRTLAIVANEKAPIAAR